MSRAPRATPWIRVLERPPAGREDWGRHRGRAVEVVARLRATRERRSSTWAFSLARRAVARWCPAGEAERCAIGSIADRRIAARAHRGRSWWSAEAGRAARGGRPESEGRSDTGRPMRRRGSGQFPMANSGPRSAVPEPSAGGRCAATGRVSSRWRTASLRSGCTRCRPPARARRGWGPRCRSRAGSRTRDRFSARTSAPRRW